MNNKDIATVSQILAAPLTFFTFIIIGIVASNSISFFKQWQVEIIISSIIAGLLFAAVELFIIVRNFQQVEKQAEFKEENYKKDVREMVLRIFGEDRGG